MLEISELVCLNTLYIACAILCSKISRFFKQPSTHELQGNRKQSQIKAGLENVGEGVFIVWNSLHCYVPLRTLEVYLSVAIRQHKLSLFLVRVISIGILLLISAKLRGVHGRDLQIYHRHFLSCD